MSTQPPQRSRAKKSAQDATSKAAFAPPGSPVLNWRKATAPQRPVRDVDGSRRSRGGSEGRGMGDSIAGGGGGGGIGRTLPIRTSTRTCSIPTPSVSEQTTSMPRGPRLQSPVQSTMAATTTTTTTTNKTKTKIKTTTLSRPRRIIEPLPDTQLPPKYKPVARRVTTIIVGIPIVLVLGWELFGRWKEEMGRKYGGRMN